MSISVNLPEVFSGFLSTEAINQSYRLIEEALEKAINREGGADNEMQADLDMGLNNIFNLKAAILSHQAVPLQQVQDLLASSSEDIVSLIQMEDRTVATEGQTEVELEVIVYTPTTNSLMVFVDGEYQRAGFEYLETGNDRIEFTTPLVAGQVVDIFGSRYDAQQYVELAITAANNAAQSESNAEQSAQDAQDAADIATQAAGYKLDVNNQTGVSYQLQIEDAGDFIRMDNAADNEVVVPPDSTVNFEMGTIILVRQVGDGTTTITPGLGVTVNAPFNEYSISDNDFGIALVKVDVDEWDMIKAFGGVDTADLAGFTQEFDARLDELFKEILSANPTFVVNFDSLRNLVFSEVERLQNDFDTFESNVTNSVQTITNGFAAIEDDFAVIENTFSGIQSDFNTIQSDFTDIQNAFSGISSDFTTIQNEWTDIDQRIDVITDELQQLNLGAGFESQQSQTGYTNLPNGLILQWGRSTAQRLTDTVVSFPKPFPNTCFNVSLTDATVGAYSGVYETGVFLSAKTRDNFTVKQQWVGDAKGGASNSPFEWFAIGN